MRVRKKAKINPLWWYSLNLHSVIHVHSLSMCILENYTSCIAGVNAMSNGNDFGYAYPNRSNILTTPEKRRCQYIDTIRVGVA